MRKLAKNIYQFNIFVNFILIFSNYSQLGKKLTIEISFTRLFASKIIHNRLLKNITIFHDEIFEFIILYIIMYSTFIDCIFIYYNELILYA